MMKISSFLITFILVGTIFVGMYSFMFDLASPQHFNTTGIDYNMAERYNKISEIEIIAHRAENETKNIGRDDSRQYFTGIWDAVITGKNILWGAKEVTTGSIGLAFETTTQFINDSRIYVMEGSGGSNYIFLVITTILIILFIGAVMYLVLQREW